MTGQAAEAPPPGVMFGLLRDAMVDVMGCATTATLLRRAARRAAASAPELASLVIARDGFEYTYQLPAAWTAPGAGRPDLASMCVLLRELLPLLAELTGPVVVRRLATIPELHHCGPLSTE